jgi:ribosomal protein S18 acetylase RimI-like enzyme
MHNNKHFSKTHNFDCYQRMSRIGLSHSHTSATSRRGRVVKAMLLQIMTMIIHILIINVITNLQTVSGFALSTGTASNHHLLQIQSSKSPSFPRDLHVDQTLTHTQHERKHRLQNQNRYQTLLLCNTEVRMNKRQKCAKHIIKNIGNIKSKCNQAHIFVIHFLSLLLGVKKKEIDPLSSSSSSSSQSSSPSSSPSFYIRDAVYSDLGQVANILIESFYNPTIIVRQYLYLSELSRLQDNFPYSDCDHSFFVACEKRPPSTSTSQKWHNQKEKVIGFVDVNQRPRKKESDAPRPYLSDLAVHPDFRRRGVAQALMQECEREVQFWGKDQLYLRVERKNEGALKMYSGLGYEALDHHYFGVKDTTILLRRGFVDAKAVDNDADTKPETSQEVNSNSEVAVDYII